MTSKREKPVLLTAAPDAWNNACIQPYVDGWQLYAIGYRKAADLGFKPASVERVE